MLDEKDAYEENAEKYFRNIQWINVSIIFLDLFLPCFWYIFSLPSIILLIFLPIGIGGITGLLAVEFAFERKFKQITAKFAEYIGHNTFAFILFAYSAGYFFLLKVLMNLPDVWILLGLNLVYLAFLIITWINPVKMQWIKKASGSISPELSRILAEISSKWGISEPHVYIIDWRKLKIANAFQMGINNYHIFISNYLIENLTPGEIAAIMTHELAHARMKHVAWSNVIQWSLTFATINLFGFAFVFLNQGAALIINQGAALIIAASLIIAGSIISLGGIGVILPFIQRRFESAADLEAIKIIDGHFLISALEKLAHLNLTPSKFPKYSNMSHPSTNQRVERIRLAMAENS